ncbi:MAG: site-2 protease family protein [Myxococcota bacterium]
MNELARATNASRRREPSIGGIPLGRVAGIRIAADWSVLVIFALVATQLGMAALPAWHPGWGAGLTWAVALGAAVLFFVSILLHELSHSVVAKASGMGVRGITLFIFGGVSQIEGEAPSPKAEFLIAIVGPLTSIAIGIGGYAGAVALGASVLQDATAETLGSLLQQLSPGATLLLWLGLMNFILGVFNMVPGFPLDGGRVLRSLLWWGTGSLEKATRWASRVGQAVAFALIAWGVVLLFGNPIAGLWRILIGWFLNNAAKSSYQQMMIQQVLHRVTVRRVMREDLASVPPELTVAQLVHGHIMRTDQRCFPVLGNDRLVGLVCLADVRTVPEAEWESTRVDAIMTPASDLSTVAADDAADEALRALASRDVDQLPVMEGDRLVGMVRRQDLVRWLSLHLGESQAAA